MQFPASTGEVARILGVSEPRINDLIRRNKIAPMPAVHAGRRLWQRDHIRQAAVVLGVLTPDLDADTLAPTT